MPNFDINQLATNTFGLSASGYVGSQGPTGYLGSAGANGAAGANATSSNKPKISNIQVTDSSYTVLDDTAVDTAGGYIKITGTGFASGCNVLVNQTTAVNVTFISATEVRARVPAATAGTYIVYLVNADGSVAIRVNGVTFSATPSWVTAGSLSGVDGTAISYQLSATGASTYSLQAGSTLPGSVTLSNVGLISGTVSGISADTTYNFTVVATDTELQDSPRAFALTITAAIDPYFKNTTLLLAGNGTNLAQNNTFLDSSTNNIAITRNGNATQGTFTPYGNNWSVYFNGTSDYLTVPSNTALQFGTGDLTVELWFYLAEPISNSNGKMLVEGRPDGTNGNYWNIGFSNTGSGPGFTSGSNNTGVSGVVAGQWYHFAATRSGTTLRTFLNGVLGGTTTDSTNLTTSGTIKIGDNAFHPGDTLFNGYISNVRIIKGTALYTSSFTPSTAPLTAISGTSLLTCQNSTLTDTSSIAQAVSLVGTPKVQRFSPFAPSAAYSANAIGGSAYFDGTGDVLVPSANDNFAFGTGAFCIEAWIYNVTLKNYSCLVTTRPNNGSYADAYHIGWDINGGASLYVNTTGRAGAAAGTFKTGVWQHFVCCRNSSNLVSMFVNGVRVGTETVTTNFTRNLLGIGDFPTTQAEGIIGYISNLRLVKGSSVYDPNQTAITIPTAPLTAIANTSLLCNFTNAGVVDNAMMNTIETVADAKISTTQSKFGGSSMYFDGTGDSLNIFNNHSGILGTRNFTVEAWIYTTVSSGTQCVYDIRQTDASASGFYFGLYSTNILLFYTSGALTINAGTVPANTWTHIALVRVGNTFTGYINGTSVGTATSTNNFTSTVVQVGSSDRVTSSSVNYFNGYIDDLRVTRGVARYTANFTPPTIGFYYK